MSDKKEKKPSVLKSLLSKKTTDEPKRGGRETAGKSPLREFMELPVDLSIDPLASGREMTRFLEERLGVTSESLVLVSSALDPLLFESHSIPAKIIRKGSGHDGNCPIATGVPLILKKAEPDSLCRECNPECSLGEAILRLPLMMRGRVMGVLTLTFREWPALLDDEDFFASFSRRAILEFKALILAESNRLLEITDNLTHVINYSHFLRMLDAELDRSRRYDHEFTLLLADIEQFQDFNRKYGYDAGDVMLREVARRLRASIRVTDIVARYSGQQFAMVLTETDRQGGLKVMEKMIESVADLRINLPHRGEEVGVRINMGSAVFPRDATVSARLIICAEDSLVQAKSER